MFHFFYYCKQFQLFFTNRFIPRSLNNNLNVSGNDNNNIVNNVDNKNNNENHNSNADNNIDSNGSGNMNNQSKQENHQQFTPIDQQRAFQNMQQYSGQQASDGCIYQVGYICMHSFIYIIYLFIV